MSTAEGYEEFVVTVEEGSLTGAARRLGMPRATLSRRLGRLEERLSVRLMRRTTRSLTLTEAGRALFGTAQPLVRAAREAEAAIRRLDGVPRGCLRVALPAEMPQALLSGWLASFLEAWPEVQLEVLSTSENLDLVAGGLDVTLRAGEIGDDSLVVRTLARDDWVVVGAPGYLDRRGRPEHAEELVEHACIVGFRGGRRPIRAWPLRQGGEIAVEGRLAANQMGVRQAAAKRGLGLALVVERMARRELEAGELERVLPEQVGKVQRLALAWPEREYMDPKVRVFVDHMAACIHRVRG